MFQSQALEVGQFELWRGIIDSRLDRHKIDNGQTMHLGPVSCRRLSNTVPMRMSVLAGREPPKLSASAKSSSKWPKLGLPLRSGLARPNLIGSLCRLRRQPSNRLVPDPAPRLAFGRKRFSDAHRFASWHRDGDGIAAANAPWLDIESNFRLGFRFASKAPSTSTTSTISKRRSVTPAAIAGETFSVWCSRTKL
jgi:hypothetical protein